MFKEKFERATPIVIGSALKALEGDSSDFVLFFNHLPADDAAHDTSWESFNKYWHFPPIPRIIRALDVGAPLRNLPENLPLAAFWQVKETGYRYGAMGSSKRALA